jgi:hypothetical protein
VRMNMVSEKLLIRRSAAGETFCYTTRGIDARLFTARGQQDDRHSCFATVLDEDPPCRLDMSA